MEQILDAKLEIKVFKYVSKEEMENHIKTMSNEGWKCERHCEYMLNPSSTITEFCKEINWKYTAEFNKKIENVTVDEPTSYESEMYWFNIYESENE